MCADVGPAADGCRRQGRQPCGRAQPRGGDRQRTPPVAQVHHHTSTRYLTEAHQGDRLHRLPERAHTPHAADIILSQRHGLVHTRQRTRQQVCAHARQRQEDDRRHSRQCRPQPHRHVAREAHRGARRRGLGAVWLRRHRRCDKHHHRADAAQHRGGFVIHTGVGQGSVLRGREPRRIDQVPRLTHVVLPP